MERTEANTRQHGKNAWFMTDQGLGHRAMKKESFICTYVPTEAKS